MGELEVGEIVAVAVMQSQKRVNNCAPVLGSQEQYQYIRLTGRYNKGVRGRSTPAGNRCTVAGQMIDIPNSGSASQNKWCRWNESEDTDNGENRTYRTG